MSKKHIKETQLYDSFGDPAAISVNLSEVQNYILQLLPQNAVTVHLEDYDDHGCDHYVKVTGECANIIIKKEYGGLYCPTDYIVFKVVPHSVRHQSSKDKHEFYFKEGVAPKDVQIGQKYSEAIRQCIDTHKQFLVADPVLFGRIDTRYYSDGRGVHKVTGVSRPYSYDLIYVSDDDFYIDNRLKLDIVSCEVDVDEQYEAALKEQHYVFNTPLGTIFIAGPFNSYSFCCGESLEHYWTATHVVNDVHPSSVDRATPEEAFNDLFNELAEKQRKVSFYSQMINESNTKHFGLVFDTRVDGQYHSPGEKLFARLVCRGNTPQKAIRRGLENANYNINDEVVEQLIEQSESDALPGYSLHLLSDMAVDYFSSGFSDLDRPVLVKNGRIELESRNKQGEVMSKSEYGSLKAIFM